MLVSCIKFFTSSKICSILLCFLRCFHILDLVLPSSHHAAMAVNSGNVAHHFLSSQNPFGKRTNEKHLFGKRTNEKHLFGKRTNENLFGSRTSEKHLFGTRTNEKHLIEKRTNEKLSDEASNRHLIDSRFDLRQVDQVFLIQSKQRRHSRQTKKQKTTVASTKNSSEPFRENITKPLNEKENLSSSLSSSSSSLSSSNISELHSSCCLVSMATQTFKKDSSDWTTNIENWTQNDDTTREITHEDNEVITTNTQILDNNEQHKAAIVVGIVFGAIAAVLFIGAASIVYVYVKRRLSHNTLSKTDLSSILEDHMTMSYIETRYDRQRNMSDEVVSLDNDSFLQSLETTSLSYLPTSQKSI